VNEARGLYDRALAQYEQEQDGLGQANTLKALGDLAREAGDPAAAAQTYQRALGLYAREQEPMGMAYTFAGLALCLHTMRREAESHQSLQQALDFAARTGTPIVQQDVLHCVDEVLGSTEAAQAWLARHAPPAAPPPA
jgi:tetratricopeptide (TPR) repeat protein